PKEPHARNQLSAARNLLDDADLLRIRHLAVDAVRRDRRPVPPQGHQRLGEDRVDTGARGPAVLRRVHLPDRRAQGPDRAHRREPAAGRIPVRRLREGNRRCFLARRPDREREEAARRRHDRRGGGRKHQAEGARRLSTERQPSGGRPTGGGAAGGPRPAAEPPRRGPRAAIRALAARIAALERAVESDDETIRREFERLTRRHRALAPLAFTVTALFMLLDGLRLLIANRRLLLVAIPSAAWIWLAMYDLKAHVLHGRTSNEIRGAILIPLGLGIVAATILSFFLNAVFAFAIDGPRPPLLRPAFQRARTRIAPIATGGAIVGIPLAVATLGAVVGVMMVSYVAVPSRLIGVRSDAPRRDRLTASVMSTAIGTTVSAPGYVMLRVGILMLGSRVLLIPGIVVCAFGAALHAGATGAVRAIKLNAALMPGGAGSRRSTPG